MKFLLLTLITSITCHKVTILERRGNDKNTQGEIGDCINLSGSAIGQRARDNFELNYYEGKNCRNNDFILWAYGNTKFDRTYNYRSVKFVRRTHNLNNNANVNNSSELEASSGSFGVDSKELANLD